MAIYWRLTLVVVFGNFYRFSMTTTKADVQIEARLIIFRLVDFPTSNFKKSAKFTQLTNFNESLIYGNSTMLNISKYFF